MEFWDIALTTIIVVIAGIYTLKSLTSKKGCSSCSSCNSCPGAAKTIGIKAPGSMYNCDR
ncbi:MAG: hypothetical protein JEZ12_08955 [Desulfobacterium sp.]|nr:hypothetical protein [Desulfobacterium sp.]